MATQGLVGYWKLDEPVTQAQDSSGNGNNGTIVGTPQQTAKAPLLSSGTSYGFDGSSQYVKFTQQPNLGTEMSVSLWIKASAITNASAFIHSGTNPETGKGFYIRYSGTTNYQFLTGDGGSSYNTVTTATGVGTGSWVHIVGVVSLSGKFQSIYINSALANSISITNTKLFNNEAMAIGSYSNGSFGFFNGTIDDVRIYNTALSSGDIATLASGGSVAGAVGWWKLDEQPYAKDSTGYGNNGSWIAAPTPTSSVPSPITFPDPYGLTFNGSSQYVSGNEALSTYSFVQNSGVFTVSAWIKTASNSASQTIVSNNCTTVEKGFYFGYNNVGNKELNIQIYNGINGQTAINSLSSSNVITDTNWHHVLAVGNGTNVTFYVDGVSKGGSSSISNLTSGNSTRVINIGRYNGPTVGGYFNGSVDDVRIYNYALSPTEISGLYAGSIQPLAGAWSMVKGKSGGGLVGYWKLDETSGTSAADSTGYGNTGTYVGSPTLNVAPPAALTFPSRAVTFNGGSQYVSVGKVDSALTTNAFWIYPTLESNPYGSGIIADGGSAGTNNGTSGIVIYRNTRLTTDGSIHVMLANGSNSFSQGSALDTATAANVAPLNTWTHVAVVTDSTTVYIYINSLLVRTNVVATGRNVSAYSTRTIGWMGASYGFNGSIDDVRVYNRALTSGEISGLYAGSIQPLAGAWSMIKGNPSAVSVDSSGNGNNGTFVNKPVGSAPAPLIKAGGMSLTFNGTSQYLDMSSSASNLIFNSPASISFWMNPTNAHTAIGSTIYFVSDTSNWATSGNMFMINYGNWTSGLTNEVITIQQGNYHTGGSSFSQWGVLDSVNAYNNKWTNVVVVADGASWKVFFNGVLQTLTKSSSGSWSGGNTGYYGNNFTSKNYVMIGADKETSATDFFPGSLDDVRIYNKALSGAEITDLAAGNIGLTDSTLVGWWKLDATPQSMIKGSASAY